MSQTKPWYYFLDEGDLSNKEEYSIKPLKQGKKIKVKVDTN